MPFPGGHGRDMTIPIPADGPLFDHLAPDPPPQPLLRISGPGEILQVIPYLLGFHPQDSVVLVALRDRRIVVSARYDLQAPPEMSLPWLRAASEEGATSVLVVLYSDVATGPPLVHREYVDRLGILAVDHDLRVTDRLVVSADRWWSYDCDDARCCPPEGTAIDRAGVAATGAVAEGLVTLPGREDLAAELMPLADETAAVALALGPARAAAEARSDPARRADEWATVRRFVRRSRRRRTSPTPEEAAGVLCALIDVHVRDATLGYLASRPDPRVAAGWRELTRMAPAPWRAPVATLLAFWCYAAGEGARTNVALDVAMAADPDYSMAQLLAEVVTSGVNPMRFIPDLARECRPIARRIERRKPTV